MSGSKNTSRNRRRLQSAAPRTGGRGRPAGRKVSSVRRRRNLPYEVKPTILYPVETLPPSLPISKIPVTCVS